MTLPLLFLAGLFLSVAAYLAAAAVLLWARRADCAVPPRDFQPAVSIVKPLAGLDDELEENLESFFRLDYPDYEVIFSFARGDDPAFSVARRAADRHPHVRSVFVVDPREPNANSKVNRLASGVRHASHRYYLFSDGNVRVRPDFLRRAVAPFRDRSIGLVSHLFRGSWPRTLASRLECLYLNGPLQAATAAISRLLGMPCVVGKSILLSRDAFQAIGGFAPVRDYLAEDFLLGKAVRGAGYRVFLSADVLDTSEIARTPAAVWARHRRWAMLRSRLGGAAYAAELLASPLLWFVGAVLTGGARPAVWAAGSLLLLLRYTAEALAAADAAQPLSVSDIFLLPLRDAGVAGVFWAGLLGKTTSWRGRRIRVGPATRIEPEAISLRERCWSRLRDPPSLRNYGLS